MNSIGTTRAGGARAARKNGLSEIQQGHYTLGDVISQFRAAMQDAGITLPDAIIADGEIKPIPYRR
jgi:hypothetical protein